MSKAMIQLDHIDVTFQQKKRQIQAVKDVTIHINEGDIYGIVGYSGAGKSTLVRVINLLQVPSAGTITVDGDVIYQDQVTLKPAASGETSGYRDDLPTLQLDGSNDCRRKCSLRS